MKTIDPTSTLGEIVVANPELTKMFDNFGIDYCCGGKHTLVEAVDKKGLDLDHVLEQLATVKYRDEDGATDWSKVSMLELVDHIEFTHHQWLHQAFPRLRALAEKVENAHSTRHEELHDVRRILEEIQQDFIPHLQKEDLILFPMIRKLSAAMDSTEFHSGSVEAPISMMCLEHDRIGELLVQLREAAKNYALPPDACMSYTLLYEGLAELEEDTHIHVHKENNILFPSAIAKEKLLIELKN